MSTQLLLLSLSLVLSIERIDASYFKAPLTTSKSRQTTSEDAWALFVRLCRYGDDEYSSHFSISFSIEMLAKIRSERDTLYVNLRLKSHGKFVACLDSPDLPSVA